MKGQSSERGFGPPQTQVIFRSSKPTQITNTRAKQLYQRFLLFLNQQRLTYLRNRLSSFYAKNFATNYKQEYNFKEQWEETRKEEREQPQMTLLQESGKGYSFYALGVMMMLVWVIWVISYERFFETRQLSNQIPVYAFLLCVICLDIVYSCWKHWQKYQGGLYGLLSVLLLNKSQLLCALYALFCSIGSNQSWVLLPVQFVVIVVMYKKAAGTYQYIKIMELGLKYEYQVKIFDLTCNILIQAHLFAIILYGSIHLSPCENWAEASGVMLQPHFHRYIRSLYYASTTILTIGYGDITPKSPPQIILNIFIQIVGVISFGYLLNEMGHTLSKMRQNTQQLERDLRTITKISKYYNLEKELKNKAKTFVYNHQSTSEELRLEDQKQLMDKLDEGLRYDINLQNSLSVIKSSIFFLCHWSKQLQSQLAKRLERRLFAPNQLLNSSTNSHRLYILKRGSIALLMNLQGNPTKKKTMKVMTINDSQQVSNNVYGYSAILSNRPVRLVAVAKEFTSTYSVDKESFIQCARANMFDWQYFHQIKSRIDQSTYSEEWEAPSISNWRNHYNPSRTAIFRRYRSTMNQFSNQRQFCVRRKAVRSRLTGGYVNKARIQTDDLSENTIVFVKQNTLGAMKRTLGLDPDDGSQFSQVQSDYSSSHDELFNRSELSIAENCAMYRFNYFINREEDYNQRVVSHGFQSAKNFNNFFTSHNLDRVLTVLQIENCKEAHVSIPGRSYRKKPNESAYIRLSNHNQ